MSNWHPVNLLIVTWFLLIVMMAMVTIVETTFFGWQKTFGGEVHDGYIELARNISQGNGYLFTPGGPPVFHRPPLYAHLLVPAAATGSEFIERIYVVVLNAFFLAGAAMLVFVAGRRLFGPRHGLIAYALLICNPWLLHTVRNPMAAIVQMALYLTFLCLCAKVVLAERSAPTNKVLLWSLLLALCSWMTLMSHGVMMLLVPMFLSISAFYALYRREIRAFLTIVIATAIVILATIPWTIRNYEVTGHPIIIAGNSGLSYFAGNAHWGIGMPYSDDVTPKQALLNHLGIDDSVDNAMHFYGFTSIDYELRANAAYKRHIKEHPDQFSKKLLLNGIEYYFPAAYYWIGPTNKQPSFSDLAQTVYFLLFLSLALRGMVRMLNMRKCRVYARIMVGCWGIYAASYLPFLTFVGFSLYNFGTLPFIALFAAAAFIDNEKDAES